MQLFSGLYKKVIAWSHHRHAPAYLYTLSFAESSFFPIPPDFMLAPMSLAKPEKSLTYAAFTTLFSILGALLGYAIGYFFMHLLGPYIQHWGYAPTFAKVNHFFEVWGFWVMFVAAFGPIPYKFFTITGGALHMALAPFLLGSLAGRGGRFFLVALLIRYKGESMEKLLLKYIDRLGWVVLIGLLGWGIYHFI
ncbi:MAG TPA: YqaA family protein [Gammaproteobacteria bacterium]|nr:YqaA family protein [Gammaproteobacteria bacterium]